MSCFAEMRLVFATVATVLLPACDLGLTTEFDFVADTLTLACTEAQVQSQGGQTVPGVLRCQATAPGQTKAVNRVKINVANAPATGATVELAPASAQNQMQQQPLQNGSATFTAALAPQPGQGGGQSLSFFVRVLMAGSPLTITAAGATVDAVTAASQQVPPGPGPAPAPTPQAPPTQPPATQTGDMLTVNLSAASTNPAPQQPQQPGGPTFPQTPSQQGASPQQQMDQGGCQIGFSGASAGLLPLLLGLLVLRRRRR